MRFVIGIAAAEVCLIYVRATTSEKINIGSPWWWIWIVSTVAVAWLGGYITHKAVLLRRSKRERRKHDNAC